MAVLELKKFSILPEGRDEIAFDLKEPGEEIKEPITLKEGCNYQIKLYFIIKNAIMAGIRYHHQITRKDINMDKASVMVGSHGPKDELQTFVTEVDEAPKGMTARGEYKVASKVVDDDGNNWHHWVWHFDVKSDW